MASTPAIRTQFTQLLDLKTPVVLPPMAFASGGVLAAEVSLAGGFGFIGSGYDTTEKLRRDLETARTVLKVGPGSPLSIGVGFLGWILDKSEANSKELLALLVEYRVKAIWLAFGDNLSSWIQFVRELNQQSGGPPILVFVQVCSFQEALTAINEWKADVVVVQGIEAGGHGASYGLPLLTLLPLILANTPPNGPPIIGAGGLADGSQVAALLTLGASGAVLGTRFLLSPESLYSEAQRKVLVGADSSQSVRTMAFDNARGTVGWPKGIDGRGIRNATVDDYDKGVDTSVIRKKYEEASAKGDTDRIVVWAGTGVGSMKQILPAKDIVRELHEECLSRLRNASNLVIKE
ncbi:hypothetical protein EST38_g1884 [Candolleomyces aberdarensis]|uniref:Nitronate monooxygenase domain-containing protein n=1 Tax=Candolleomyces aberdarensis TaxID=2316362 RepID=A0A4Q2DX08_9AGAR|nr:hypothetical protein EST38_g1884 [Candolleomyces aberdarensis]